MKRWIAGKGFAGALPAMLLAACSPGVADPSDPDSLSYHTPRLQEAIACNEKGMVRTARGERAFHCLHIDGQTTSVIELVAGDELVLGRITVKVIDRNASRAGAPRPLGKVLAWFGREYVEADPGEFASILDTCPGDFRFPGYSGDARRFRTEGTCKSVSWSDEVIFEMTITPLEYPRG